jgi:glycosyltransferase involved in cell wall biosynthesis
MEISNRIPGIVAPATDECLGITMEAAASTGGPTDDEGRPAVAIVANAITPYRVHLHRRIAREIPEIRLWTVFTHEESNSPWPFAPPEEIGPVRFGVGESSAGQASPRNAVHEWRKGGRITRWLEEQRVRAVLMLGYNDPGRLRIIRWSRRSSVPCFLVGDSNIRSDRGTGPRALAKRAVVGWIVRSCTAVMPCGTLGREYFMKYGADPDRIFFFPYEPDYDLIRDLRPESIEETRSRFALSPARRRIVFSGRLIRVKRPELVIDAFAAIADSRPEWDLLVIGSGPLAAALQARVPQRLRERVQFAGFVTDPLVIAALYRLSDVLALPSDHEPWALVINEAAAASLAIVSSDVVGAAAELVRDGVNGRVFPKGDRTALIERLLEVTAASRIDSMKASSPAVLEDWRRRADPVAGLRGALQATRLICS